MSICIGLVSVVISVVWVMYACHLCAMNVCFLQQEFKYIFCVWCSVECMHVIHVRREQCIVGGVCVCVRAKSNSMCGCDSCSLLVNTWCL